MTDPSPITDEELIPFRNRSNVQMNLHGYLHDHDLFNARAIARIDLERNRADTLGDVNKQLRIELDRSDARRDKAEAERDELKERERVRQGIWQLQQADRIGELEAECARLRKALERVMAETGTSSLAHHAARDALAPKPKEPSERMKDE